MATLSKGVQLGYADHVSPRLAPPTYDYLTDITGIPALGASPASHQVTTLADAQHVYIKGLQDVGGTLDFSCVLTEDLIDDVLAIIDDQLSPTAIEWCVEFPSPLLQRAYFTGEANYVFNEAVEVDAPIMGTLSIVPSSAILWEAYTLPE